MSDNTLDRKKTKSKRVLSIIIDVIVIIFLVFAVTIAIMSILSANQKVPSIFGYSVLTVQSDSMEDTFSEGDLIICQKIEKYEDLKIGDVISFWTEDMDGFSFLDTHRIIDISYDGDYYHITTKGDNVDLPDDKVLLGYNGLDSDIVARWNPIGKDRGIVIKGVGGILDFLQSQKGILICFVIPLSLFFIWALYKFIISLVRYREKDKTDEEKAAIEKAAIEKYILEHGGTLPGTENADPVPTDEQPVEDGNNEDTPES